MAGNLLIPRVRVKWGGIDLTSYPGGDGIPAGEPLVFNVQIQLNSESQGPTGEMLWNPTGAAFRVYEKFLTDRVKEEIEIEYFYEGGKKFKTKWLWSGQTIAYGNDMGIRINLVSALAGSINGTQRAIANVADGKTELTAVSNVNQTVEAFNLKNKVDIVWEERAKKDAEKTTLNSQYARATTAGAALNNGAKAIGHIMTPHNIGKAGIAYFTPFSFGKDAKVEDGAALNGETKPEVRYGYLVGPSLIDTLQRDVSWTPPQLTTDNTPATQQKPTKQGSQKSAPNKSSSVPKVQENQQQATEDKGTTQGTSGNANTPNFSSKKNQKGPEKQLAQQQENQAKLQLRTFLVPVYVGLKPQDILYVPSLTGNYIEDWIVQSVNYTQTDGGVDLSVTASRTAGFGTLMQEDAGKKFKEQVKSFRTLEDWENYAWTLKGSGTSAQTPTPAANVEAFNLSSAPPIKLSDPKRLSEFARSFGTVSGT